MWLLGSIALALSSAAMSDIKSDEVVVFYPTYAYLGEDRETWAVAVRGIIYEPEEGSIKRSAALGAIRRAVRVEAGTPEAATFDRRVRLFLVDNERGKEISVRLGAQDYSVGRSQANGHFHGKLRLPVAEADRLLGAGRGDGDWVSYEAVTRKNDHRRFVGRVQLVSRTGLSVISDIDDTIKDTEVGNREAMLRNTFARDFRPVVGMAKLYAEWARQGVVFHYVSGSPWQLYLPLADFFRSEGFPRGSMHLKHFRLTDSSALSLLESQEATKLGAIEPILAAFPGRRFVLVGDSGEQDPEIYGKIARKHSAQIAAILIRDLSGEAADRERLRRAFEGIPRERWRLFRQPEQLERLPAELSRSGEAETESRRRRESVCR